jgi:molybdopterin molybdotransferase
MLSVNEVIKEISSHLKKLPSEPVNLVNGLGRVLASDVSSRSIVPLCDICNIKGYAVNSQDFLEFPVTLNRVGKSRPTKIYNKAIRQGETVEVFEGCPLPPGADSVIAWKHAEKQGKVIIINEKMIMPGMGVSSKGIDIAEGDIILKQGTALTSRHIALADSADLQWLPVVKKPRIGIVANIDKDPIHPAFHKIQATNNSSISNFLSTFVNARGGVATNLGVALDVSAAPKQIISYKKELLDALESVDLLVVIGGLHMEGENLVWTALLQTGAKLKTFDVAIGGGDQLIIGNKDKTSIIGLPDQRVASIICALLFLKPTINQMLAIPHMQDNKVHAILNRDLDECDKENDYLYAKVTENEKGDLIVSPVSAQDSLMISVLTETDCLVVVDAKQELKKGTTVEVIMFTGSIIST